MTRATERREGRGGDEGLTLIELLVSMAILAVIMSAFFLFYFSFAQSSTNTVNYSEDQSSVRGVTRILESDIRSADPLTLVPASFLGSVSLPSGTVTSSGTDGTAPTDVLAMYENDDRFTPCSGSGSTTTTSVPAPYLSSPFSANVVWAYDKATGTLTRYSYVAPDASAATSACQTGGWMTDGVALDHVVNAHGTMFGVSQGSGTAQAQVTTPSSTTVANQAAPACGSTVSVYLELDNKKGGQQISFRARSSLPLPNQSALQPQACG